MDRVSRALARRQPAARWDLWLPLAGALITVALLVLAVLADQALRQRRDLALDGAFLRLAHRLEIELRETPPAEASPVLDRFLRESQEDAEAPTYNLVQALALLDGQGLATHRAGPLDAAATRHDEPGRDILLFLGRLWALERLGQGASEGHQLLPPARRGLGQGGLVQLGHPAVRTLRVIETAAARGRPLSELLLLPAAAVASAAVLALAVLGGRLLRRQQEVARQEASRRRLEGLGRAGAGLAHQLRTPLATLKGTCQLLAEDLQEVDTERQELRLQRVLGEVDRMEALLGQLLDYARPPAPEARDFELKPLCDRIVEAELDGETVRVDVPAGLQVCADPQHVRQILDNLLQNAMQAVALRASMASTRGTRGVELAARRVAGGVEIRIADAGDGPGDDPEHLFEPYVTGRAAGTGLGLPIARALAEANGGSLHLQSREEGGTVAVLMLPAGEA